MKFEDLLMQRDEHQKRLDLEDEVVRLQEELDEEQKLHRVLQCASHGPVFYRPCLSSLLPRQVQVLLAEIAMVEEEIIFLERKVEELRLCLYQEKKQTKDYPLHQQQNQNRQYQQQHQWRQRQQRNFLCGLGSRRESGDVDQSSPRALNAEDFRNQRSIRERKASLGSASDFKTSSSTRLNDEEDERSGVGHKQSPNHCPLDEESTTEKPNKLSEEMIQCLITIFLKLNGTTTRLDCEPTAVNVPKLTLSCISTKGLISKASFQCKTPIFFSDDYSTSMLDPYGTSSDLDGAVGDVGPYKHFIHFTRSSLDMSRVSECFPAIGRLRVLMHKLCTVDLSLLTYKQKLAFWINIYNACIMHTFLHHGLPSSPDKLLTLMNKAALNVGGIVLNSLAIEHFILRHPSDTKNGVVDEKEVLLRHAYGLGYPEPNVTFALCRGSWSSPALRVYTSENIVNELERAKVEYLEASVGVSPKKKILVPKLLHWHMRDFADDTESLLEWIYSQLPRAGSGSLKRSIMECLNGVNAKYMITKMVEVQPYESDFRYLLPL